MGRRFWSGTPLTGPFVLQIYVVALWQIWSIGNGDFSIFQHVTTWQATCDIPFAIAREGRLKSLQGGAYEVAVRTRRHLPKLGDDE